MCLDCSHRSRDGVEVCAFARECVCVGFERRLLGPLCHRLGNLVGHPEPLPTGRRSGWTRRTCLCLGIYCVPGSVGSMPGGYPIARMDLWGRCLRNRDVPPSSRTCTGTSTNKPTYRGRCRSSTFYLVKPKQLRDPRKKPSSY